MSKQSEAKSKQLYTDKAIPQVCVNCNSYKSEIVTHAPYNEWTAAWTEEKNLRCSIGGFAVKKQGTCALWEMKK